MANTFIFDDDEQPDTGGGMSPGPDDDQQPEEGEGGNRTFTFILIGLGVALVIALLCVLGFILSRAFGGNQGALSQATLDVQTQEAAASQTQLAIIQASPTLEPTQTATETPTTTPVVVVFATETSDAPTEDPSIVAMRTELALTQLAQPTGTITATPGRGTGTPSRTGSGSGGVATPTASIPKTGFAEDIGLPALGILTIVLLGVILLARRLRAAPGR
jgi:hypothetical protein